MSRPTNPDAYWNRREKGRPARSPALVSAEDIAKAEVEAADAISLDVVAIEEAVNPTALVHALPVGLVVGAGGMYTRTGRSMVEGSADDVSRSSRLLDPIKAEAAEMERYRLASRRPITSLLPE